MVRPLVITLAVGALSGAAAATYPSTFPFENEKIVPVFPPAATPSHTFDDEDPGGYVYTYVVNLDDANFKKHLEEGNTSWGNNGHLSHLVVTLWGLQAINPISWFNCSGRFDPDELGGKALILDDKTWDWDTVSGTKYCDSPEVCCLEHHGKPKYRAADDDTMNDDKAAHEEAHEMGLCTATLHQGAFCSKYNDYAAVYCNEQLVDETERSILQTCFDSMVHPILSCPVFLNTAMKAPGIEPDAYLELMTNEEWWNWSVIDKMPDHVCFPYSYFFPEMAVTGDDDDDDDDVKASSKSSDSAAAAVVAGLFGFVLLL